MRSDESCLQWCDKDELGFNQLEVGRLVRHKDRTHLILVITKLDSVQWPEYNYHDDYYFNLGDAVTLQCQITGELTTANSVELL